MLRPREDYDERAHRHADPRLEDAAASIEHEAVCALRVAISYIGELGYVCYTSLRNREPIVRRKTTAPALDQLELSRSVEPYLAALDDRPLIKTEAVEALGRSRSTEVIEPLNTMIYWIDACASGKLQDFHWQKSEIARYRLSERPCWRADDVQAAIAASGTLALINSMYTSKTRNASNTHLLRTRPYG